MTVAERTREDYFEWVDEVLNRADHPDPQDIGALLVDVADEDQLRWLAFRGGIHVSRERMNAHRPPANGNGNGTVSARWESVVAAQESGDLDRARFQVAMGPGQRKWFDSCTVFDFALAMEWMEKHAQGYLNRRDQYEQVVREIKAVGGSTGADLPNTAFKRIFHA